jgi:23S rRNA maturation-related 3'-5' exoribonuclease YhaM
MNFTYQELKNMVCERKTEFDRLMTFLETKTEYLTAPASTKYHMCTEGGLLSHSVNVANTLLSMKNILAPDISDESCVIVALLHDLGKVGLPGEPQYIKNEPSDKQKRYGYPASTPYSYNTGLTYLSVPIRSLYLALPYLSLSSEETQAIAYHDGQYVDDNRSVANKEEKLTLLLQYADNWSGFVIEMEE